MLNSCDGLLCLYEAYSVSVLNPSTVEFRCLSIKTLGYCYPHDRFAIGRDPVTKRYKIVRVYNPVVSIVIFVKFSSWIQIGNAIGKLLVKSLTGSMFCLALCMSMEPFIVYSFREMTSMLVADLHLQGTKMEHYYFAPG
ncbi:hypothetical protein V6N13_014603 [Hibiscus sabdariffa]|uniref:F-box associated beta-propeller type 1 domain-containing protein n=1 Tax=Hibiscus sabdariffa TaxID=183260 RepID=A0ABR2RVT7_9ROSI